PRAHDGGTSMSTNTSADETTETTADKGGSYIPQIHAAWEEVVEGQKKSIASAIKLGDLLNAAKEAVGHGKWKQWLSDHSGNLGFSHRTANVYMRLADNKHLFDGRKRVGLRLAAEHMSIRKALDILEAANSDANNDHGQPQGETDSNAETASQNRS